MPDADNIKQPVVYLPGLPKLSSEDTNIVKERMDLVNQLATAGYRVEDIISQNAWLKTMLKAAEQSDAFIFPPMISLNENRPNFKAEAAQRLFEFFSVVTGIHVGTPEKYGSNGIAKPCIVDGNNEWSALAIQLLNDLHKKGMFSSKVEDIVQVIPTTDSARDYKAINSAIVKKLTEVIEQEKGKAQNSVTSEHSSDRVFESFRKHVSRHPFGVAVFGSATTKEPTYTKFASDVAKLVAERGWRMTTGAGIRGCMGAADEGFAEGKKEFNRRYPNAPFKPAHIGVSTQPILRLEGPPPHLDQLIVTGDIYDRMRVMIKGKKSPDNPVLSARDATRVVYVFPGGTGTVHEFATLIQLATNGGMMEGRKIVLCNPPSHLNPSEGFWDPLLKIAKKLGFDNLFEVAHTPEEAIAIGDKVYEEWLSQHQEHKNLPHPIFCDRNPRGQGPQSQRL